jgi:arylsulfatase B
MNLNTPKSLKTMRLILFLAVSLLLSGCKKDPVTTPTPTENNSAPNIIFIIADDLGWDGFGNYPGTTGQKAKTPTLDSMARSGITFTNYWVYPECSPTRAAMLTGKYGFRTGIGGVQTPPTATLSINETIIHNYINTKTNGAYATALIGKWHVSANNQLDAPESFGVGYYSGFLIGALPDYYNWTQTSGGKQQAVTTYATTHFVNQSVSWIRQQTKPFFLWLALNAPHSPYHRPPLNLISNQTLTDNQATINANPLPYYLASIEAMDKEIARLIGSLTSAQKENTVFVFMGDNGTPTRVAQLPYTSTGSKSTLFQGGVNTPLLVCGKAVSRKNAMETALAQAPDLFATMADVAGTGTTTYLDGISLKPLFSDEKATKRTFAYTEFFGNTPATNDGYAIRNGSYKLIRLQSGTEYLFNLSTDPFEKINLMTAPLSADATQNLTQLRTLKLGL